MSEDLTNIAPQDSFGQILCIGSGGIGLTATLQQVYDGDGTNSPLWLSLTAGKFTEDFEFTQDLKVGGLTLNGTTQDDRLTYQNLNDVIVALSNGTAVNIACYGDSQTDGNNTTSWTANPTVDSAVPASQIDHAATAPNSWSVKLEAFLRDFYESSTLRVYNAGYSGKRIIDGWAYNNYENAINSHPTYSDSKVVFLKFGENDGTLIDSYGIGEFVSRGLELDKLVRDSGRLPVWLSSEPAWKSSALDSDNTGGTPDIDLADRENTVTMGIIEEAKKHVCKLTGSQYIDLVTLQQAWLADNISGYNPSTIYTDDLHANDTGHNMHASILFTHLVPKNLFLRVKDKTERINFQDPKSHFTFSQDDSSTFTDSNTYFRDNFLIATDKYGSRLDDPVMNIYVFVEKPCTALSRLITNCGQRSGITEANLPDIQIFSWENGSLNSSALYDKPIGGQAGTSQIETHSGDRIHALKTLDRGLYKLVLKTPKIATYGFFGCNFEFNIDWEAQHNSRFWVSDDTLEQTQYYHTNALKNIGVFKPFIDVTSSGGNNFYSLPENSDGSNVAHVSQFGDKTRIYFEGRIPEGMGFLFNMGRVLQVPSLGTMGDKRYFAGMGFLLYRNIGAPATYDLFNVKENGNYGSALKTGTSTNHIQVFDNQKYMIEILKDSAEKQIIRIADTWEVPEIYDSANGWWESENDVTSLRVTPFLEWKAQTNNSGLTNPFSGTIGLFANTSDLRKDRNLYLSNCFLRKYV